MSDSFFKGVTDQGLSNTSIDGSVVECSPATRAARVRFPDDAQIFWPGAGPSMIKFLPFLVGGGWLLVLHVAQTQLEKQRL